MQRLMNTASRDRVVHKTITEYFKNTEHRNTPVSRIKVSKVDGGGVKVALYTSRPNIVRAEQADLATDLREGFGDKAVTVEVVAEARAVAKFVRCSPRKARLVIETIKGKRVSEALSLLRFIPNHASEHLTKVLNSAAANAFESWGADPDTLKVSNFIADGGPSLKRLRARAQGRAYRILKRTSHLTVVLTEMPAPLARKRPQAAPKKKAAVAAPKPTRVATTTPAPEAAAPESTLPEATASEMTAAEMPEQVETQTPETAGVE